MTLGTEEKFSAFAALPLCSGSGEHQCIAPRNSFSLLIPWEAGFSWASTSRLSEHKPRHLLA